MIFANGEQEELVANKAAVPCTVTTYARIKRDLMN
jgi:hypothetical protein